jgi:hypothetical protein
VPQTRKVISSKHGQNAPNAKEPEQYREQAVMEIDSIRTLIRFVTWEGRIYSHYYTVEYVSKKGRLISQCPEALFQGLKPARLYQLNSYGTPQQWVLITTPDRREKDLQHFMKCTGIH